MTRNKRDQNDGQAAAPKQGREALREQLRTDEAVTLSENDLAQAVPGRSSLQGDDQAKARNQRLAHPDERTGMDDIVESLEKLERDVRARTDPGEGSK